MFCYKLLNLSERERSAWGDHSECADQAPARLSEREKVYTSKLLNSSKQVAHRAPSTCQGPKVARLRALGVASATSQCRFECFFSRIVAAGIFSSASSIFVSSAGFNAVESVAYRLRAAGGLIKVSRASVPFEAESSHRRLDGIGRNRRRCFACGERSGVSGVSVSSLDGSPGGSIPGGAVVLRQGLRLFEAKLVLRLECVCSVKSCRNRKRSSAASSSGCKELVSGC